MLNLWHYTKIARQEIWVYYNMHIQWKNTKASEFCHVKASVHAPLNHRSLLFTVLRT